MLHHVYQPKKPKTFLLDPPFLDLRFEFRGYIRIQQPQKYL